MEWNFFTNSGQDKVGQSENCGTLIQLVNKKLHNFYECNTLTPPQMTKLFHRLFSNKFVCLNYPIHFATRYLGGIILKTPLLKNEGHL